MAKRVLQDKFFRQAKREGYLARSAYKLIEINERHPLLKPGFRVLDLGCSPGSWLQVAAERVGRRGRVVGIDLKPVTGSFGPNVRTAVGDFTEADPADLVALAEIPGAGERFDDASADEDEPPKPPRLFNTVLSDMAPNTSGHGDHFRSVRLCRSIVEALPGLLRPRGSVCMKVFDGEELADLLRSTRRVFAKVSTYKPRASRDVSKETFIVARGYRPPADAGDGGREP